MWTEIVTFVTILSAIIQSAVSLQCYRCHSTQPGCGKELNIRLQDWWRCPDPGQGAGENFCVKVIENKDGEQHITRECLMTLMKHTEHRRKIPTVQRHGYCEPARNNDPYWRFDNSIQYCFCNDWNGCNSAPRGLRSHPGALVTMAAVAMVVARLVGAA